MQEDHQPVLTAHQLPESRLPPVHEAFSKAAGNNDALGALPHPFGPSHITTEQGGPQPAQHTHAAAVVVCIMCRFQAELTMMFLARWPSPLALARYSVLEMVERGLPRNSRMRSRGRATRPMPANIMNSSHPAVVTRAIT